MSADTSTSDNSKLTTEELAVAINPECVDLDLEGVQDTLKSIMEKTKNGSLTIVYVDET